MTFNRQKSVSVDKIWKFGQLHMKSFISRTPPSCINSIDIPRANFNGACSFRWGSTSFFTPTSVNTV